MGKLVTLGGDRLGSGKKMKQAMHNYERSNHDLSYDWRSTAAPGTLIPFMNELMLPGDTFDIDLNAKALTMPTVGPLMGSFKLQLDVFLCPFRLYQAQLHNNKLGVGLDMSKIKLPQFEGVANMINFSFGESPDTQQVNPSSLIAYQGTRGFGCAENEEDGHVTYRRNALKLLSYYDIYKNYYANMNSVKEDLL